MDVEWDEGKRLANIAKHGIDFVDAARVFEGKVIETWDRRRDYGERRLQGRVIHVAYTWRQDRRRIISARRASRNERETYYASLSKATEENEE